MAKKTAIEGLQDAVNKTLEEYAEWCNGMLESVTDEIAADGVKALRKISKETFPNGTGQYAKSWTVDKGSRKRRQVKYTTTIYSTTPGLPHLLENGHAKRGGGRVPGRAHIAPIEKELIDAYKKAVEKNIDQ